MTTRLLRSTLLFALLSLIFQTGCVLALGNWKVSSYDDEMTQKKTESASKGREIVIDVQKQVAVHEAGHAVAMAILFGTDEVQKVVVNTRVDNEGHLGHANWINRITRRYTLDAMRRGSVVSLAARSADMQINGAPVSGSSADLDNANSRIWNSYISYGLGGTPEVWLTRASAPKWVKKKVRDDILDAEKYADELVAANLDVIKALAEDIMGIKANDAGKRIMEADVFKAFCQMHVLKDPRAKKKEAK